MSDSPSADVALVAFRQQLYAALGHRQDSLFELTDAVLSGDGPCPAVRHSLSPLFRRRWPSVCDALNDGRLDAVALQRLWVATLPAPATGARLVWALDGTVWPRPAARTSPARTIGRRAVAGARQAALVPVWEYQWLVAVPEPAAGGSWVLPLDVCRRGPAAGTPTALALGQLRATLAQRPPAAARPVVTLDSGYDASVLAQAVGAGLGADLLVRLATRRTLYHAPGPSAGLGAPRKHGAAFKLHDPTTHRPPAATASAPDPTHGTLTVDVWTDLHDQSAPGAPFRVARVHAAHLPHHPDRTPAPLWLAWIGSTLPTDLLDLWRWYARRFTVEHGFRFAKQAFGWTTVRLRHPAAGDRWTRLVATAFWQLWLARPLVADTHLPWERPRPPLQLTPGRVRRALARLLPHLGSPARAPKSRGKSPGRRPGERPPPPTRFAVVRRPAPPSRYPSPRPGHRLPAAA